MVYPFHYLPLVSYYCLPFARLLDQPPIAPFLPSRTDTQHLVRFHPASALSLYEELQEQRNLHLQILEDGPQLEQPSAPGLESDFTHSRKTPTQVTPPFSVSYELREKTAEQDQCSLQEQLFCCNQTRESWKV